MFALVHTIHNLTGIGPMRPLIVTAPLASCALWNGATNLSFSRLPPWCCPCHSVTQYSNPLSNLHNYIHIIYYLCSFVFTPLLACLLPTRFFYICRTVPVLRTLRASLTVATIASFFSCPIHLQRRKLALERRPFSVWLLDIRYDFQVLTLSRTPRRLTPPRCIPALNTLSYHPRHPC